MGILDNVLSFTAVPHSNATLATIPMPSVQLLTSQAPIFFALVLVVLFIAYRRSQRSMLDLLPGPPSQGIFLGNKHEYDSSPVGEKDLEWRKKYGKTFKFSRGWDECVYTSDPKALQYVLQVSGYSFQKDPVSLKRTDMFLGPGLLSVEADEHKRHRRAMLPAFALPQTKALTATFQEAAIALSKRWAEMIDTKKDRMEVNIHAWLARTTLDAIGEAAFGTKFGALDDVENELSKNFNGLLLAVDGSLSILRTIMVNIITAWPDAFSLGMLKLPLQSNKRMLQNQNATFKAGRNVLAERVSELDAGGEGKDLLSLLVKSNGAEVAAKRLTDVEVLGQMSAVMFAGHETTATTSTFALWELSKQPHLQERIRAEIRKFYKEALEKGEETIPVGEYEKMEFTQAVLKETLRYNTLVPQQFRRATKDLSIPLSDPVKLKDGRVVQELQVKKGTDIILSNIQYNRHTELWGDDAGSFNPDRWLQKDLGGSADVKYGAFANLATFGGGVHVCIGWRFAVYELQAILIEMLNKFRFEMAPASHDVQMMYGNGLNTPLVKGNGMDVQLPLYVSLAE